MNRVSCYLLSGLLISAFIAIFTGGCGDESEGPGDTIPPMAITNLSVVAMNDSSVTLSWTAPGDDCQEGTASQYDIRYSLLSDTTSNWWDTAWEAVDSLDSPKAPWELESLTVGALAPDTVYYFALKTADEVPNWSGLSNVTVAGVFDSVPPAAVGDLSVEGVTDSSIFLTWTAPGDDGMTGKATQYNLRYGTSEISSSNWDSSTVAIPLTGEPMPGFSGALDSFFVGGLRFGTRYYFAITTADERGNWSGLSNVADGVTSGLSYYLRTTITGLVTEYLPEAYSGIDSSAYEAALDGEYLFELLDSDIDPGDPDPWWDKQEELDIAGNMFESRFNDTGQRVERIQLEITDRSTVLDHTNYPYRPPSETWYRITALIDLLVVVEDPQDPEGVINFVVISDQIFGVRPDPENDSLWVIHRQVDQYPFKLGKASPGHRTEETSWGSVKSLFR